METQIRELVEKYFLPQQIESISIYNNRVIITLINAQDNQDVNDSLEKSIKELGLADKVSIIHTSTRPNVLNQAEQKWQISGVKKIIAVASGKGGVGKSTTAVNLALALSSLGQRVALFDADIYGPSIPTMIGYEGVPPVSFDGKTFQPFEYLGIKSMSIGSLIDKDVPLIWRGAKACGAIEQLLTQVNWGEIDIMVIDMPPGTGDIQITLSQKLSFAGAVIVSTPQDIALIDAIKGVNMFSKVDVSILGIVENMSYYICPKCGNRDDIFGHAGARETADKLKVDFLGEVPLHIDIRTHSDQGKPIVYAEPSSIHSKAYIEIAGKVIEKLS